MAWTEEPGAILLAWLEPPGRVSKLASELQGLRLVGFTGCGRFLLVAGQAEHGRKWELWDVASGVRWADMDLGINNYEEGILLGRRHPSVTWRSTGDALRNAFFLLVARSPDEPMARPRGQVRQLAFSPNGQTMALSTEGG